MRTRSTFPRSGMLSVGRMATWLVRGVAAAAAAGRSATDCAQLVEALGIPVRVVEGDPDNLKITLPADLVAAERQLAGGDVA